MKLVDIVNARKVISAKATEKLEFKLAYKFAKLIKLTNDDEDFYNKHQRELFDQYCKRDEEGNVIPDENGCYQFENDKIPSLNKELEELADTEVEIPEFFRFTVEELKPIQLSIKEVVALGEFIKDDTE